MLLSDWLMLVLNPRWPPLPSNQLSNPDVDKQTAVKLRYPIITHLLGTAVYWFLNGFGCNFQELWIYMPGVSTPIVVKKF